jgi:hypothetical protein
MRELERLADIARGVRGWRDLDYTARQLLLRKLFTVPFLAALPVMLAAGLVLRLLHGWLDKAVGQVNLA